MSKIYNLKKAAWYATENITKVAFGLVSVIVVARMFGPENLGKLSYVQALSATVSFLVVLGLDHIVVRDTAKDPTNFSYLLTVFVMQTIGWVGYSLVVYAVLWISSEGQVDYDIFIIYLAVSLTTYFSRATVLRLYFQAVNQPRKLGESALISRFVALAYLAVAIWMELPYYWVVLFIPVQATVQFLWLFGAFIRSAQPSAFKGVRFDFARAKALLLEAIPLIGSSILFPIFMQADILIISHLLDKTSVGIYSSAAKLVMQLVFLGHIITMTFYLSLSNLYFDKDEKFDDFIRGLTIILIVLSLILASGVSAFSDYIIYVLYGEKYQGAGDVLAISVWCWVFIFPAALYSRLLIIKGLGKYEFIKSAVVAVFSVLMNFLLVPKYGIEGAAVVSVLSYFMADFLLYMFFKDTRGIFLYGCYGFRNIFTNPKQAYSLAMYTLGNKS